MGFGLGFDTFGLMFNLIFALVITMFIVTIIKGVMQWNKNNHSPRLNVVATVVDKHTHVSHHNNDNMHSSHTTYYVTFEFQSKDRIELGVPRSEYGYIVEGDTGELVFQGTRFISFTRQ